MAIIFIKEFSEDKLYTAYNNNIVEFYTDSLNTVANAEISVDGNIITLFPSPASVFSYNIKDLITTLLNIDNFKDDLNPDLDTAYMYDWTDKVYLNSEFFITINFTNDTNEISTTLNLNWLSAYVNLRDWKTTYPSQNLLTTDIRVLQKVSKDSYYQYKTKYWEGYPLDITLWLNSQDLNIKNNNNLIDYDFLGNDVVDRLVFSDGRTDVSIEDIIPLQNGFNDLSFNDGAFNLQLNKTTDYCTGGVYIKWINSFGGWSYWYFVKGNEDTKTKDKGNLFNDNNNLEDTISPLISLGKESGDIITVQERNVNEDYKDLLIDLLDSAKVYLFAGLPFSKNTFNDWIEVNLSDGTYRKSNSRTDLYTFNFKLELPPNITRSL